MAMNPLVSLKKCSACSTQKIFCLSVFGFDLFDKYRMNIQSLSNIQYIQSHSNFKTEGKIKFIALTYSQINQ